MEKLKILAIYRGKCMENRGTPIRVRSLLERLDKKADVDLTVFSWDKEASAFSKHFFMSNKHLKDIREISSYIKKNKIDVVIGHTEATSYYLVALKFLTRVKIVLEMHGATTLEAREYGDISWIRYQIQNLWHIFFYSISLILLLSTTGIA
jgi:hypothetical protein